MQNMTPNVQNMHIFLTLFPIHHNTQRKRALSKGSPKSIFGQNFKLK